MTKLYIGNLADNAKEKDIRELFQAFGEVEEVALLRGYGFVVSACLVCKPIGCIGAVFQGIAVGHAVGLSHGSV